MTNNAYETLGKYGLRFSNDSDNDLTEGAITLIEDYYYSGSTPDLKKVIPVRIYSEGRPTDILVGCFFYRGMFHLDEDMFLKAYNSGYYKSITYDERITYFLNEPHRSVEQRFDTDTCSILYGSVSTPHGSFASIIIVYKDGKVSFPFSDLIAGPRQSQKLSRSSLIFNYGPGQISSNAV